jgi:hypothetical protein
VGSLKLANITAMCHRAQGILLTHHILQITHVVQVLLITFVLEVLHSRFPVFQVSKRLVVELCLQGEFDPLLLELIAKLIDGLVFLLILTKEGT